MIKSPGGRSRRVRDLLTRWSLVLLAGFGLAIGPMTTAAYAHAERLSSNPEENSDLNGAPSKISIDFSEPPTGDANLVVMDGCGSDVVEEILVENMSVSSPLAEGQPGTWVVRTTVVSGVDGHKTQDSWKFTVKGQKDCSAESEAPKARDEPADEDDDSSFPVIPVAIGAIAVVGVALVLRALTGRSAD